MGNRPQGKEFDRIEMAAKLFAPPPIKFKDLDAFVSEHKLLTGPVFPFDVRTDFVKVTESMDMVPITLQIKNRDITFLTKDGVAKGMVNILMKVTTITGKTVQTQEDTVEVDQPAELLEKTLDRQVGLLEGHSAGARPLPARHCHQGREQPRSHRLSTAAASTFPLTTMKNWARPPSSWPTKCMPSPPAKSAAATSSSAGDFVRPRVQRQSRRSGQVSIVART